MEQKDNLPKNADGNLKESTTMNTNENESVDPKPLESTPEVNENNQTESTTSPESESDNTATQETSPEVKPVEEPSSETESKPSEKADAKETTPPTLSKTEESTESDTEEEEDDDEKADPDEITHVDYTELDMNGLVAEMQRLMKDHPIQKIKSLVEEIKKEFQEKDKEAKQEEQTAYDQLKKAHVEKEEHTEDFAAFEYNNPITKQFENLHALYRKERGEFQRNRRKQQEENLEKRKQVIEEIKNLIDQEENIGTTFNKFNDLQKRWNSIGKIPHDAYNTTWNDYRFHMTNFYDYIDLSKELRDKDFEHNLEILNKIIKRAEELAEHDNVHEALRELQELHRMWKEDVGPVAKEHRDETWDRFSAATKKIHDKRQAHYEALDKERENNQVIKENINIEIERIASKPATSHRGWQDQLTEIKALKELFFATKSAPKEVNDKIWEQFKKVTRVFNKNKNDYYKGLKREQQDNLDKKMKLIEIAEEHRDAGNFNESLDTMKRIQREWKEIGHVPRRVSDKIWKRFQGACNAFFEQKNAQKKEENKAEVENYDKKLVVYDRLKSMVPQEDKQAMKASIESIMNEWNELGRVPYSKRHLQEKFDKLLKAKLKAAGMTAVDAEMMKYETKLSNLEDGNERDMKNERFYLRKRREEIEKEMRQLENNLQFINAKDDKNPFLVAAKKNIADLAKELEIIQQKEIKVTVLKRQLAKEEEAEETTTESTEDSAEN